MNNWYLIKDNILTEVEISSEPYLQMAQIGGYIGDLPASISCAKFYTEAYCCGAFTWENPLEYNTLAFDIYGCEVYGPLIVLATDNIIDIYNHYKLLNNIE